MCPQLGHLKVSEAPKHIEGFSSVPGGVTCAACFAARDVLDGYAQSWVWLQPSALEVCNDSLGHVCGAAPVRRMSVCAGGGA